MNGEWTPTRWWRVTAPDGSIWCESSDHEECLEEMRPGDTLYRLWRREQMEWRKA